MSTAWEYFWPALGAGAVIGLIASLLAFQRADRRKALVIGMAATLAAAAIWHGPLGGANRLAVAVERHAALTLAAYEMTQVRAKLGRQLLSRRLELSGVADDFQRSELALTLRNVPGVSEATWNTAGTGIPLIAEGMLVGLGGYLLGLLLGYLVVLHRRHNAQWDW